MKKLIISMALSAPLLLTSLPSVSAPTTTLDNPVLRTDASVVNNNEPTAGATYAYWYRWHWHRHWHRWYHWHY